MMHFTVVHWILTVMFIMIFGLLAYLSLSEQNKKTRLTLLITSFVVVLIGLIVSLLILDKYTKKAKVVNYSTHRNYNKESVSIVGRIKNTGKFYISYCTLDLRIVNKVKYKGGKFMYKTSSASDLFKSKGYKKNFFTTSVRAIEDLKPKLSKSFRVVVKIPSHFDNPKYFLHLVCH